MTLLDIRCVSCFSLGKARLGRGVAYSTECAKHLLQVQARKMSADSHIRRVIPVIRDERRTACVMFRVRGKPAHRARSLTVEVFHGLFRVSPPWMLRLPRGDTDSARAFKSFRSAAIITEPQNYCYLDAVPG
jgi:hypothetical protein